MNLYKILSNTPLTKSVYKMVLEGDTSAITASGQFINIELTGKFLRRPISICDWNETTITIIYKVVGEGTRQMAEMKEGETLDILVGLGNGFNTNIEKMKHPLLVGGGVGVPPMYGLAKKLLAEGKRPTMIMGFNTAEEVFYDPRHPYTWALLSSMPDLDTNEKLDAIPGTPPNMIYPPVGDAFAARNKYAMKIDFERQPPMFKISDTHYAATWLLHPDAPKVDRPKVITDRIERMKSKRGANDGE